MSEDNMNIYQRINEVRRQVGYVKKDATVLNYKAVTHDAVQARLRPHLIEHGVVVAPSLIEDSVAPTGTTTKGGTPIIRYEAVFEVRFINIDEPGDFLSVRVRSHANDEGDKAPGKAMSYAVKMAELKVFTIETGENDESRVEAIPAQDGELQDLAEQIRDCMERGDADGMAELLKPMNEDLRMRLNHGTPRSGGIFTFKEKQEIARLEEHFDARLRLLQRDIEEKLNAEIVDGSAVLEALEELTDFEKKVLSKWLSPTDVAMIRHLKEAANGESD